jgi:hypothetical protein
MGLSGDNWALIDPGNKVDLCRSIVCISYTFSSCKRAARVYLALFLSEIPGFE